MIWLVVVSKTYLEEQLDKILCDKPFNTAKNLKLDGHQKGNASMVYKFFDIKSATHTGTGIVSDTALENQQLEI